MKQFCDLHTHSVFSDGTYTPDELIKSAIDAGLCAIALCDHNTVDGLEDFLSAADEKNIEAVAGSEFSVDYNGKELHLLGLFIPQNKFADVSSLMADVNARKEQSNIELIRSLRAAGYDIDYDAIKGKTPNGKFNRAHVAAELTAKGYTESRQHAFDTLLSVKAGHYKEPQRLTLWEMLDFIKDIKAVPVLAHPFLNLSYDELYALLPAAKERGLVGMECAYSTYDEETEKLSIHLADEFGLKYSGGSDFHGANKPDISLGIGRGTLRVPYEWLEALKESIN